MIRFLLIAGAIAAFLLWEMREVILVLIVVYVAATVLAVILSKGETNENN